MCLQCAVDSWFVFRLSAGIFEQIFVCGTFNEYLYFKNVLKYHRITLIVDDEMRVCGDTCVDVVLFK